MTDHLTRETSSWGNQGASPPMFRSRLKGTLGVKRPLGTLVLAVGIASCGIGDTAPTAVPTEPTWADRPPTSLFLTPVDVTYLWNEQADSELLLPVLQIDRSVSPARFGHHWTESEVTLWGMVDGETIDITAMALIVSKREGTRQWLADFVEVLTNQFAGAPANDAASVVDELDSSGDERIYESVFADIRLRYEERPSGHWFIAVPGDGGDPGLLRDGEAILAALRERETQPPPAADGGERETFSNAFTTAGFRAEGDALVSPEGLVRVELAGDDVLSRVVYRSDFTHDDEVAESLLILTGALDRLADGAGTWAYDRITNRPIDETRIDDSATFDGATVHVDLTQNPSGSDWGEFVITFQR